MFLTISHCNYCWQTQKSFATRYSLPRRKGLNIGSKLCIYRKCKQYKPELPEAKALTENIKKQLEGYQAADTLIAKVNTLVKQLISVV
jgi:hypothetical protein